ncbi:hypothetical protein GQ44DRAFT_819393 [Phaeosphaeriaceae sp. PMI808]|nr:hypothetical protein GQ44DRAFT_819393 [Phaeosphaeriaceae sp. PMI808]
MHKIYAFLNAQARSDEDWRLIKTAFKEKKLVLGQNHTWHTLSSCLWKSPFPLDSFQDLSHLYNGLEDFFVKRLRVKKASPGMLINEVKRMAGEATPRVQEIRKRLVDIGMMLSKAPIDDGIEGALESLKEVKFLPKRVSEAQSVLVGIADDFAIPNHLRYAEAMAGQNVLLDFKVDEVQILHTVFQHMRLTHRYLSTTVKEVSAVGVDLHEDESLSKQLQDRAYALYCLRELDEVLIEQDVPPVDWIEKPVLDVLSEVDEEPPSTPTRVVEWSDTATLLNPPADVITPVATPSRRGGYGGQILVANQGAPVIGETSPPQYPQLIEQVVRSAQRASNRYIGETESLTRTVPQDEEDPILDHFATFGSRDNNAFEHDRRIGAAGEGYVFALLTALHFPNFTEDNWRSTIRGELAGHSNFATLTPWHGRETADMVYTDSTGTFTGWLRDNSEGDFPIQISETRNFRTAPIEYYLEVKSTTRECNTRFYMSGSQYKRMQVMRIVEDPRKVYVVMRVYNLTTPSVGMKIFVDPLRFQGSRLDFEAEQWFVKTM